MGWSRVSNPGAVVSPGDEITVKVLRVDEQQNRISLSIKELQEDPWTKAAERYAVGQVLEGRVTRLADFGAFVELEPGIEALAHVSTFPPTGTPDGWKASVPPGTGGAFEILSVDPEQRRIGVAMLEEGSVRAAEAHGSDDGKAKDGGSAAAGGRSRARSEIVPGARLTGKVERHERYGVFVFLAPGRTGLMPLEETGLEREGDLRKAFPVGSDVEVMVLETDPGGRRIRLSRRAVVEAREKREADEYARRQAGQQTEGFGSLADKLRSALGNKDD
jgi:small subunit ribosomal protein S1